jgi:hypothetical protein
MTAGCSNLTVSAPVRPSTWVRLQLIAICKASSLVSLRKLHPVPPCSGLEHHLLDRDPHPDSRVTQVSEATFASLWRFVGQKVIDASEAITRRGQNLRHSYDFAPCFCVLRRGQDGPSLNKLRHSISRNRLFITCSLGLFRHRASSGATAYENRFPRLDQLIDEVLNRVIHEAPRRINLAMLSKPVYRCADKRSIVSSLTHHSPPSSRLTIGSASSP